MDIKEKIIEYIKLIYKEFNIIIILLLVSFLLSQLHYSIFTVLFIFSLAIVIWKIIKINMFIKKLEDVLNENNEIEKKETYIKRCNKDINKKSDIQ